MYLEQEASFVKVAEDCQTVQRQIARDFKAVIEPFKGDMSKEGRIALHDAIQTHVTAYQSLALVTLHSLIQQAHAQHCHAPGCPHHA